MMTLGLWLGAYFMGLMWGFALCMIDEDKINREANRILFKKRHKDL